MSGNRVFEFTRHGAIWLGSSMNVVTSGDSGMSLKLAGHSESVALLAENAGGRTGTVLSSGTRAGTGIWLGAGVCTGLYSRMALGLEKILILTLGL